MKRRIECLILILGVVCFLFSNEIAFAQEIGESEAEEKVEEIAAYLVDFEKKGNSKGYAVVDNKGNILEYSYGTGDFIENAQKRLSDNTDSILYYLGDFNYVINTSKNNKDKFYDALTGQEITEEVQGKMNSGSNSATDKEEIIVNPSSYYKEIVSQKHMMCMAHIKW